MSALADELGGVVREAPAGGLPRVLAELRNEVPA